MSLEQGDLFIVHDVGDVTSFGMVIFTGPYDYQRLTQTVFTREQQEHWSNIATVIVNTINIPVSELRTVVIEPIDEAGDPEMIKILEKVKSEKHPHITYLTRMKNHKEMGAIHSLFKSDQEVNRNMAASMIIGALNECCGDLV